MKMLIRTLILIPLLGFILGGTVLAQLQPIVSAFNEGETVSAGAFNELFEAINDNFTDLDELIDILAEGFEDLTDEVRAVEEDVTALKNFRNNMANTVCPQGRAFSALNAAGSFSCADTGATVIASVRVGTAQANNITVPGITSTPLAFGVIEFATAGTVAQVGGVTRLIAAQAGIYQVNISAIWGFDFGDFDFPHENTRSINVHLNDVGNAVLTADTSDFSRITSATAFVSMQAGEFLTFRAFQRNGPNLVDITVAFPSRVQFMRVGPIP